MKKYLSASILFILLLFSCESINDNNYLENSSDSQKKAIFNETGEFSFKIIDNNLLFSSLEDYDNAIKYLQRVNSREDFFKQYGFYSLVSSNRELPDNCTPILAILLSSDCELIIKNYLFKLDFSEETLMAINLDNSQKQKFSFEDDVLEILFSDDPLLQASLKSMPMACTGREKKIDWEAGSDIHMKYNRAGIYYWLTGELNCGNNQQIAAMTVHKETCCYKPTDGITYSTEASDESGYAGQKARITVYQGMRRLNSFYFLAYYDLYDLHHNIIASTYIDLGCFCNTCECVENWN